jgi:hypothetical protein
MTTFNVARRVCRLNRANSRLVAVPDIPTVDEAGLLGFYVADPPVQAIRGANYEYTTQVKPYVHYAILPLDPAFAQYLRDRVED